MRKTYIYLAAGSADHALVASYARRLEATGLFVCTHEWFKGADEWAGRDSVLTREEQARRADECLAGIASAQLFWLLLPRTYSFGCAAELGAALERKRVIGSPYIVVTGPSIGSSIFHKADYRDHTNELGFVECVRFAKAKAVAA